MCKPEGKRDDLARAGAKLRERAHFAAQRPGVSDERGSIPRFGESVIGVPVTVSTLRVALNTLGFVLGDKPAEKVRYKLSGKLAGPSFGSTSFQSAGELALPTTP